MRAEVAVAQVGSQQPDAAAPGRHRYDNEVVVAGLVGSGGGGLTPLVFAAREGDVESAKTAARRRCADQRATEYGWTPLLTAVNNRNYQLASFLLDKGADPNLANKGGWTPLYLATDNRNIEGGDYPVPKGDMDHLEIIEKLLEKGANPNGKIRENTLTRTIFTMQWFFEDGATPFIRAAQSSDTVLMQLLLKYKADPQATTANGDNALTASGGIGWVEGDLRALRKRELRGDEDAARSRSRSEPREQRGPNGADGRRDEGPARRDSDARRSRRQTWRRTTRATAIPTRCHRQPPARRGRPSTTPRVSCVWACSPRSRPEAAALIRKLMAERNIPAPPVERTILSVCVVALCQGTAVAGQSGLEPRAVDEQGPTVRRYLHSEIFSTDTAHARTLHR